MAEPTPRCEVVALALLWLVQGQVVGDFAERGAVERGVMAPIDDIVSVPPQHLTRPCSSDTRIDPDMWSQRPFRRGTP